METKDIKPKLKKEFIIKKPKMYKVILINDDFTPFVFVEKVLMVIFGKTAIESEFIAHQIHTNGKAIVAIYPQEIAQTKQAQTLFNAQQNGFPLLCEIEPEDTDN